MITSKPTELSLDVGLLCSDTVMPKLHGVPELIEEFLFLNIQRPTVFKDISILLYEYKKLTSHEKRAIHENQR